MRLRTKPLWSVQYGPDHFCTTHTHRNTHTHARPQPFPWQDVEATSSRKSHDSALLPFEVRHVLFRSLWQCVCTRASQHRQTFKKDRNMNATKQFCLVWMLITLTCSQALFYLFVNSVWPLTPRFLSHWRIPGSPFAALRGDRHILCGSLPHRLHGGHCGGVPDEEHNKETRFRGPAGCPQAEQADPSEAPGNRK